MRQGIEVDDAEVVWPESAREKVVEKNWRSILRVHLDDIEKYGLEYCLYFQTLRVLCGVLFILALLGIPELMFCLEGTTFLHDAPWTKPLEGHEFWYLRDFKKSGIPIWVAPVIRITLGCTGGTQFWGLAVISTMGVIPGLVIF